MLVPAKPDSVCTEKDFIDAITKTPGIGKVSSFGMRTVDLDEHTIAIKVMSEIDPFNYERYKAYFIFTDSETRKYTDVETLFVALANLMGVGSEDFNRKK